MTLSVLNRNQNLAIKTNRFFSSTTPGKNYLEDCICLCLPPDRTWHKVNDQKAD